MSFDSLVTIGLVPVGAALLPNIEAVGNTLIILALEAKAFGVGLKSGEEVEVLHSFVGSPFVLFRGDDEIPIGVD